MDDKKQFSRRLLAIGALFSLVLAAYFVTLFDAQIVHGAEYRARSIRANTKSETVVTSRGILTDRNGKALVTNRSVYTLELDTSLAPSDDAALNKELLRLIELLENRRIVWEDTLPLTAEQNAKLAAAGAESRTVTVGVRPVHVTVGSEGIDAQIDVSELMGSELHLHMTAGGKDVVAVVQTANLDPNAYARHTAVRFSFEPRLIHLFDPETEKNLI